MIAINTRKYVFTDFVQVLEHIENLERTQFVETTGVWSYYQILRHCTEHIQFSMTHFPYTYSISPQDGRQIPISPYIGARVYDAGRVQWGDRDSAN